MAEAKRDNNYITTLLAVSNADGTTPVTLYADPVTHRLLVDTSAGGGGANTALNNLSGVAINTSLISDTALTDDLGSEALPWRKLYIGSDISFEGATDDAHQTTLSVTDPTADNTITIPDTTDTLVCKATTDTLTNKTIDADGTGNSISNIGFPEIDTDMNDFLQLGNGTALDSPVVTITESGGTVSLELEKSGTGDIRILFSDGVYTLDCTSPICSVALSAGSDVNPTLNYVYILQSNKTLTANTEWPGTEHAPVATVLVQSAASVATDGAYKVHAWTDHSKGTDAQGHLAHLNHWIRHQDATWLTGMATTPTGGAATYDVAVSAGTGLQLHHHTTPAFDTAGAGSDVYMVNDYTTKYKKVGTLTAELTDAADVSMSGRWYTLVFWVVINEVLGDCKLMCNLPIGSYNNNTGDKALNDDDGFNVYDIPADFKGTGVLVSEVIVSESGGTFTVQQTNDLRGQFPGQHAGGGAVGGNEFVDNVFRIVDDGDATAELAFQCSGISTGTTRTLTVPDVSGTIALNPMTTGGDVVYGGASGVETRLANGTAGQVLTSGGTTVPPTWENAGVGDLLANGTVPLTANWDVGAYTITGLTFVSDQATGTAPFTVASTTEVANLKAATVGTITGLAPDTATTQATQASITTCANLTTVGALNAGSITSGFTSIDVGAGAITTTGTASLGDITLGVDGTISALTLTEKASIALDPAGGTDGDYSGITVAGTGGATIAFGNMVYLAVADSRWELTDASAVGTAGTVMVGCLVLATTDGGAATILTNGIVRADSLFPGSLTVGAPVYLSETGGLITQTAPTTADAVVRVIGFAITAEEIYFNPSSDHLTVTG